MENYFSKLSTVKCVVEKKNGLNYVSWSDAWAEVKIIHPDATYEKIKNTDNTYLFRCGTWGMVECSVTIDGITHTADLAVTDFRNQEIKYENIKSTDIQNTLQRAFTKAIAMHGLWLYVYQWEDYPEELGIDIKKESKTVKTAPAPVKNVLESTFDQPYDLPEQKYTAHKCKKCGGINESVSLRRSQYWMFFQCSSCGMKSSENPIWIEKPAF